MKQRALVDIDLLLDTRYGTLKRIDEKLADTLILSNLYRDRMHDNFDLITNGAVNREQYHELYARRDMETLYYSKMTDWVYHFRKDLKEGMKNLDRGVSVEEFVIDINVWPYELDTVSAEMIRRSVAHYMPPPAKVNVVRLDPTFVNPAYVDNSYEMLAYYNHEDWLGPNTEALLKHPLPTTALLTPTISTSGEIPEPTSEIRNPFLCRSAILLKYLGLHYQPTHYACHNPFIPQQIRNSRRKEPARPEPSPPQQT